MKKIGITILAALATASALFAAEAPALRSRAEVEAILAKAPKQPDDAKLRPLHIVLLADVKDHGPGAHDYPCWQKRWAVLLGGKGAGGSEAEQVNLHGPACDDDGRALAGAPKVNVELAWKWPGNNLVEAADVMVMFCYRSGGEERSWSDLRIKRINEIELRRHVAGSGAAGIVIPDQLSRRQRGDGQHGCP